MNQILGVLALAIIGYVAYRMYKLFREDPPKL
jgi:hypothetical protein